MNKLNGQAAERLISKVMGESGFKAGLPVSRRTLLNAIRKDWCGHFGNAIYHLERDYQASVSTLSPDKIADYALGCDLVAESIDGSLVSVDVTVNAEYEKLEHKRWVSRKIGRTRKRVGLDQHLLVIVDASRSYHQLDEEDKWTLIVDVILEAISDGLPEVTITF